MSLGLLALIGGAIFIIYLMTRSSPGPDKSSNNAIAPPPPGKRGTKQDGTHSAARSAAAAMSGGASKAAPNTDGGLKGEYQSLLAELSPVFADGAAAKPAKGDMAKLQRLGRLGETPSLKGVVDKPAVATMLESGMAWIDDVYGPGNATGKTRLEAFEKSAKKLRPRKKKGESSASGGEKKAITGKFGLPFDVEAFAAYFPDGWDLAKKLEDGLLLAGPGDAKILVGPHQLEPSSDLFEVVENYLEHFDADSEIEPFTSSIRTRGWAVEATSEGVSHLMVELWGPALMSARFVYEAPELDPSIKQILKQAAMNLTWLNAPVTRSDDLPVKNIRELHRHIRTVLKGNEEARDGLLSSFDDDESIWLFVHQLEEVAQEGASVYPLVRALVRYALTHDARCDVDDLCKLQSWCGVHFLNDRELAQMLSAHAESKAESTKDFLELLTVAGSTGDSARESALLQLALSAAKSSDDHVEIASHPLIARDAVQARAQLDAALFAAADVGDLRKVLDHDAATADLLAPVLERLRVSCGEQDFLSSAWNPLDVLKVACNKEFMTKEAAEAEILSLVDASPVLSDTAEVATPGASVGGDAEEDASADGDEVARELGLPDLSEITDVDGESMQLLSLAESANNEDWASLRDTLLDRAMKAANRPGQKYAIYQFLNEKLGNKQYSWRRDKGSTSTEAEDARALAYLDANRDILQPFIEKKNEGERVEALMDSICQCALLVSWGDGELSAEEKEEIQKVRPIAEMIYRNRDAIALLEKTEAIDKAREARKSTVIMHSLSSMWMFEPAYSQELTESLAEVSSLEELDALVRMYAAKIEDPFGKRLAAWTATEVASADGLEDGEKRILKLMAEVWELDLKENQRYFADFVYPTTSDNIEFTGKSGGDRLAEARALDAKLREEGGEEVAGTLAELLGVDSIEALVRLLRSQDQEEEEVEDTRPLPPVFEAVFHRGSIEEAVQLVRSGEDANQTINISGVAGLSLLTLAAEKASVDVVRSLVELGADVNRIIGNPKRKTGYDTPLCAAIKGGRIDTFDYLLEAGANPDPFADREGGWTPLTHAAQHHNSAMVKSLLDRGVNVADCRGWNAFKYLANEDSNEARKCIDLLVKAGIDTTRADDEGHTGIHNAVPSGSVDWVSYLLEIGKIPVDLPIRSLLGVHFHTPLLRAMAWGNVPVVDYLLSKGADPAARNGDKGIFGAIARASIDGSLPKGVPQIEKFVALGLKPEIKDVMEILSSLSEADDDHSRRIGPVLDAVAGNLEFNQGLLNEVEPEKIGNAIAEAMSAAPKLTQRFLGSLKKKGGLDLESLAAEESDDSDSRVLVASHAIHHETAGRTQKVDKFIEAVLALVAERGEDPGVAKGNLIWSFGNDWSERDAAFNRYVEALQGDAFAAAVRKKTDEVIAKRVYPIAPWMYRGFKVMPVEGDGSRGRWSVRMGNIELSADCEERMRQMLDIELDAGELEEGSAGVDDDEGDISSRPLLPFDGKKNSFLQASMCIYQAAAGDGLFNDEEIDGFISANEELARVYDLPDDADLIKTGVKAQKTVDAVYAKYSTIPLDEIHRNARKLATKIDDPFLQKVIVLLSIKAADADDDLNDYEMQVINIYLEKWNLSLDEVEEIDGEF